MSPVARPSVVILDRDARRVLDVSRVLTDRNIAAASHLSSTTFWPGVARLRPTVLVLEIIPPLMSAVRTVALATEMLGRAPSVVLYGWAPVPALARLAKQIPGAIVLTNDEGPEVVADAIERAHLLAAKEGRVSAIPGPRPATSVVAATDVRPARRR